MFMAGISGIIPGVNSVAVGAPSGTDPYWTSTVLLVGANGTNGSKIIPDESFAAHGNGSITGVGNDAQISTALKKFGTGSMRFDGNNDAVRWADHADWEFGSGAFTVETWALFDTAAIEASSPLVSHYEPTGNQRGWLLIYSGDQATNQLRFVISSDGTSGGTVTICAANWTPTADTFYHVAVDRSGNVFRLYVDGAMVATGTNAMSIFDSNTLLSLGLEDTNYLKGNLDEARITKGVARYASDGGYTVPTAAFPRS